MRRGSISILLFACFLATAGFFASSASVVRARHRPYRPSRPIRNQNLDNVVELHPSAGWESVKTTAIPSDHAPPGKVTRKPWFHLALSGPLNFPEVYVRDLNGSRYDIYQRGPPRYPETTLI